MALKATGFLSLEYDRTIYICDEKENKWICEVDFNTPNRIIICCQRESYVKGVGDAVSEVVTRTKWKGLQYYRDSIDFVLEFPGHLFNFGSPWLKQDFVKDFMDAIDIKVLYNYG